MHFRTEKNLSEIIFSDKIHRLSEMGHAGVAGCMKGIEVYKKSPVILARQVIER